MLNRYGLIDERLVSLVEADVGFRSLERQRAHQPESVSDEQWENALRREGKHDAADRVVPHILAREHAKAEEAHWKAGPAKYRGDTTREIPEEARHEAAHKLNLAAEKIGRHGGEYIRRRPKESERSHHNRIAMTASADGYYNGAFTSIRHSNGDVNYRFNQANHAHKFHGAMRALLPDRPSTLVPFAQHTKAVVIVRHPSTSTQTGS